MSRWRFLHRAARVGAVALVLLAGAAAGTPYVPAADDVVLERLPEKGDPALARLKRMRSALAADPRNLVLAAAVAQQALEAARALGDPRFLGQAQAALMPWWTSDDVPTNALLLRATVKQSQHDFDGSIKDLDRLLAVDPSSEQGRLTRATVLGVQGRYLDARRDCARMNGRVPHIVFVACDALPASLSGDARRAYGALVSALETARGSEVIRAWALTLAAEIAARLGDVVASERHFREALALDPRDAYLKGAYADFLLDHDRPQEVPPLLRAATSNDALLLRLALAEQRLPAARAAFAAHRSELAARFEAARRRGDSLHRREEARFELVIEHDVPAALALARANFDVQREPADLRVLLDAGRAAHDANALDVATRWIASTHVEDAALALTRIER
jgi:Tfp pilus assembly protein PilF